MGQLENFINTNLGIFTLISIPIVLFLFYIAFFKKNFKNKFLKENSLKLAFLIALLSSIGTLIYSELIGYPPCTLCWFQRVFLYSSTIILGTALLKKDNGVKTYVLPLSLTGLAITFYHYITQMLPNLETVCSATSEVLCDAIYVKEFGFITIPFMGIIAFSLISLLVYLYWSLNKN